MTTVPSSANLNDSHLSRASSGIFLVCKRSETYMMNRIGEMTAPYGNPISVHSLEDPVLPFIFSFTRRDDKYSCIRRRKFPFIPAL